MTDLDTMLRDALRAATSDLGETTPDGLATILRDRRRRPGPRRASPALVAAAVVLVAGLVAASVWWRDGGDRVDVIDDRPASEPGFGRFGPGWHRLDTGPVPPMSSVSVVWAAERLVVSGTVVEQSGTGSAHVYGFDPTERTWQRLPDPPMDSAKVVDADGVLVAVGVADYASYGRGGNMVWATLAAGAGEWAAHGEVPVAPELTAVGALGPMAVNGTPHLIWTGQRVIDVSHLAALDPSTGATSTLPVAGDVAAYSQLLTGAPVWTGDEVLLSAWTSSPGLAWSADGARVRDVPGLPTTLAGGSPVRESSAFRIGERVLLVALSPEGAADAPTAWYDRSTNGWSDGPTIDRPLHDRCGVEMAAVGGTLAVQPCDDRVPPDGRTGPVYPPPVVLDDGRWVDVGRPPLSPGCCLGLWFSTPSAVVMWSTDTDTLNDPDAPYVAAAVWVPDRSG